MPLFLLKFLPALLKAAPLFKRYWKIAIPATAALVMVVLIHFKNNKIDGLELDKVQYTQWAKDMAALNITNIATIDSLRQANDEWVELLIVSENVRASAYKAAQDRARRAQIRLDDTRTQLRDLENETPTCAEISRIDIGAACPLSVELLRRAAAGTFDRN